MTTSARQGTEHSNNGVVASVRGSVVDVRFDENLPPIYSLLHAGKDAQIAIEVLMQLHEHHVTYAPPILKPLAQWGGL